MFGENMRIFRKSLELCGVFCGLFIISTYASETFQGNFANLNEGYSKIDITGDKTPESIFLKKSKVKGTVSKLVITDIGGKLLFYISNEGGYTQVYASEEDIEKKNEFLNEPYKNLMLEKQQEIKQGTPIRQKPIILEPSEEERKTFKIDTPIERSMQDVQKKLLILGKNGDISKNESSFGFIVYYNKYNSSSCISCYVANSEGEPASDKLMFKWNQRNRKFIQIELSP